MKIFGRFRKKKPEPPKPEPTFKKNVAEIESFKEMLKSEKCPGCEQLSLVLRSFERGPVGFEARVNCTNCAVHGTVNSEGFNFQRLGLKKGEARAVPFLTR